MLSTRMNRFHTLLPLWLLAAGVGGCTSGEANVLIAKPDPLTRNQAGAAALAGAGGSLPRGGAGGAGKMGNGGDGGRSELQAGSGGDHNDLLCGEPPDPNFALNEAELLDALNSAIENKTFCGGALKRLTMSPDVRCAARRQAAELGDSKGGRFSSPVPPGWSRLIDPDYRWLSKQADSTAEARGQLLGADEGRTDHREDLCAAAQRGAPYKTAGVGRFHDTWVIIVSTYDH
jgi:hypothetical protein